jgi:hypothetical protein
MIWENEHNEMLYKIAHDEFDCAKERAYAEKKVYNTLNSMTNIMAKKYKMINNYSTYTEEIDTITCHTMNVIIQKIRKDEMIEGINYFYYIYKSIKNQMIENERMRTTRNSVRYYHQELYDRDGEIYLTYDDEDDEAKNVEIRKYIIAYVENQIAKSKGRRKEYLIDFLNYVVTYDNFNIADFHYYITSLNYNLNDVYNFGMTFFNSKRIACKDNKEWFDNYSYIIDDYTDLECDGKRRKRRNNFNNYDYF